ncbi:MAG: transposase [Chloroflexota bacterium]|nr:transposase [Chloroflexota bacterium]
MAIRRELIDELLKDYERPQDILEEGGLLKELTKAVIERCLETELDTHLGYPKHGRKGKATGNSRNGHSQKTLKGEQGHIHLEVPRDRQSTFEPQLVRKGQTRMEGLDEKVLAMYARGMTTRDIQAQLQELYGVEVSPTLISNVTETVMDEVRQWQTRPLEPVSPIVYVDCLVVNVRENQCILNKALYLVLAVNLEGQKELLGMWIAQNEGARVLALRAHRGTEPWGQRLLHCLCGWLERFARSNRDCLSSDTGTIVRGASHAQLVALCVSYAHERGSERPQSDLLSQYRSGS